MSPTNQGVPELDKALEVLTQINALLPVAFAVGNAIAGLIKSSPDVDPVKATEAVARFAAVSAEVRVTAEEWLATHPPEP